LGGTHVVADSTRLPFATESFESVASELPFEGQSETLLLPALCEMQRVIKKKGRMAVMCASKHADILRIEGASMNLRLYLDSPINRKGVDVVALAWEKCLE
jgi:ubiquinone/menaquinone biosynthesis C-methylase UbiE